MVHIETCSRIVFENSIASCCNEPAEVEIGNFWFCEQHKDDFDKSVLLRASPPITRLSSLPLFAHAWGCDNCHQLTPDQIIPPELVASANLCETGFKLFFETSDVISDTVDKFGSITIVTDDDHEYVIHRGKD